MTLASDDFRERIARINAGAGNTRHTMFVGMDESFNIPMQTRVRKVVRDGRMTVLGAPLTFAIGALAAGLSILAAFHGLGMVDAVGGAQSGMLVQGAIGLILAYLIGWALKMTTATHRIVQSMGVVATLWLLPGMMQLWPAPFEAALAPGLVDQLREAVMPAHLSFAGHSVSL